MNASLVSPRLLLVLGLPASGSELESLAVQVGLAV